MTGVQTCALPIYDYYFSSGLSKNDVDLRGADGKVTSVTRKSSTLIVYITLDSLDGSDSGYDLDVYGLEWDESDGMASWEDSGDAVSYTHLNRGHSS